MAATCLWMWEVAELANAFALTQSAVQVDDGGLSSRKIEENGKDYFQVRDGVKFAGTHLIIDVHGGKRLDDLDHVEAALRKAVAAANATLLHIHLHHFTPNGGISGVAVLAESHISIHTWPECGYAALDVFMCGAANPHATIEILRQAFNPDRIALEEHLRGRGL